ncbi:MAG: hypothetical protein CBD51_001835 [Flavobacteriales bacterium TMED191]|nr:MAG: hypothetical protein CBD51_001835 [Flavobacteriales bacterium TMED191]|tara:strand:+ start:1048 stop:1629 length:582 start_codon:yes stop_codon:yes gene_type:complete
MSVVLNSSYFPTINYFRSLKSFPGLYIDIYEYYKRHSNRNRTTILGSNGTILLTVPIKRKSKVIMRDIKIANQDWQRKHIMSIKSSYGSAPFFIHYFDDIKKLINSKCNYLVDLNNLIINYCINQLELKKKVNYTKTYKNNYSDNYIDLREKINIPKHLETYDQIFGEKFISNLSIIDLIFNLGPDAKKYINT